MRLKLDENLPRELAMMLSDLEHDVGSRTITLRGTPEPGLANSSYRLLRPRC